MEFLPKEISARVKSFEGPFEKAKWHFELYDRTGNRNERDVAIATLCSLDAVVERGMKWAFKMEERIASLDAIPKLPKLYLEETPMVVSKRLYPHLESTQQDELSEFFESFGFVVLGEYDVYRYVAVIVSDIYTEALFGGQEDYNPDLVGNQVIFQKYRRGKDVVLKVLIEDMVEAQQIYLEAAETDDYHPPLQAEVVGYVEPRDFFISHQTYNVFWSWSSDWANTSKNTYYRLNFHTGETPLIFLYDDISVCVDAMSGINPKIWFHYEILDSSACFLSVKSKSGESLEFDLGPHPSKIHVNQDITSLDVACEDDAATIELFKVMLQTQQKDMKIVLKSRDIEE